MVPGGPRHQCLLADDTESNAGKWRAVASAGEVAATMRRKRKAFALSGNGPRTAASHARVGRVGEIIGTRTRIALDAPAEINAELGLDRPDTSAGRDREPGDLEVTSNFLGRATGKRRSASTSTFLGLRRSIATARSLGYRGFGVCP